MLPWLLSLGLFDAIDLGVGVLLTLALVGSSGRIRERPALRSGPPVKRR